MSKLPFLWLILACGAVWAQPKGHIEGTVSGEDGEALYGASIAVRGPSLPDGSGSISSEEGRFRIALPAGTYEVEITFVGYRTEKREEVEARQRRQAEIAAGADLPPLKERDPDTRNQSLEARLDWRASDDLTAILAAGHNEASILGLTGVGASQTVDWQYNYTQLRLLYGDWFLQAFRNWSDGGGTYLLRTGVPVVDRSSLTVLQAQHTSTLGPRQRFTYGVDALLRYDHHSRLADPELSPRAALVFKPRETQTLRLTYNRAFSTPTSNNLYLDLLNPSIRRRWLQPCQGWRSHDLSSCPT